MGRPKRSQVEQQNAAPSSQSRLPSTSANSPSNPSGSPASSSYPGTTAVTPESRDPPETSNASDPWYPIKPTAENWDHSYKYPSRDSSVSSYAHWFGTVPSSSPSQKACEHSESPESASPPHTSLSAPSNNPSSGDINGSVILKELLKLSVAHILSLSDVLITRTLELTSITPSPIVLFQSFLPSLP